MLLLARALAALTARPSAGARAAACGLALGPQCLPLLRGEVPPALPKTGPAAQAAEPSQPRDVPEVRRLAAATRRDDAVAGYLSSVSGRVENISARSRDAAQFAIPGGDLSGVSLTLAPDFDWTQVTCNESNARLLKERTLSP